MRVEWGRGGRSKKSGGRENWDWYGKYDCFKNQKELSCDSHNG